MATNRKQIHVYVTDEEKEIIEERAKEIGLSASRYLLGLGLGNEMPLPKGSAPETTDNSSDTRDDRRKEEPQIPPPPNDGVERGFYTHPSKLK